MRWTVATTLSAGAVLAASVAGPESVFAATPELQVSVDCPTLSEEQRASVEARSRADLAVKGLAAGALSVRCGAGLGIVEFVVPGSAPISRSDSLDPSSVEFVEGLIALVDRVTTPVSSTAVTSSPETPGESPSKRRAPAVPAASTSRARGTRPGAPPKSTPARAAPILGTARRRVNGHRARATGRVNRPPHLHPIQVSIGGWGEYWSRRVFGAFGPRLTVARRLKGATRLAGVGGLEWAAAEPAGIGSRHYRAGVEVVIDASSLWSVVGGGYLSVLHLTAPDELLPGSKFSAAPGFSLRAARSVRAGAGELVIGAGLSGYSWYRSIQVDSELFVVPAITGVVVIDYRMTPW